MYQRLRPLLFLLPPEFTHKISLCALHILSLLGLTRLFFRTSKTTPIECMGLTFKNRIGIAAGLDKNGDYLKGLSSLGVGFIEVGGITPRPQKGNPKPRLHRLVEDSAIINRMGLNNKGVDYLVKKLKRYKGDALIGVNIAKNQTTNNHDAEIDYVHCLEKIFPYTDFAVINVSCPNSSQIDALQNEIHLQRMLKHIITRCGQLQKQYHKKVPLLVKISPDLDDDDVTFIISLAKQLKLDGLVVANASNKRDNLTDTTKASIKGGLSGLPLNKISENMLTRIKQQAADLPVISLGGIMSADEAQMRLQLGADLLEVYTGLVYQGPRLIRDILKKITHLRRV